MMVLFLLKIYPSPSHRREVLDILRHVVGPTSIQPGCLACEIYEGMEDDQTILFLEQWESLIHIQPHIQSALFVRLLAAMELSATQPMIRFCEISQIQGIELVEALRNPE
ncbi:MAG TPA: antibiotic biosynthesis monooxygenase [bacterium]|nr:antibiotic biosynthesis monooxygenase [bacterium]